MANTNYSALRRVAGICGVASPLVGLVSALAAVSVSPWFSWMEEDLSVLGVVGEGTMRFNYGLGLTGLLSVIFAIGLGTSLLSRGRLGLLGALSLAMGSVGIAGVGMIPRTIKTPHNLASLSFFTLAPLAIFLVGLILIGGAQRKWGMLSVAAAVLIMALQFLPWPWPGGAIPQVISSLPWSVWMIAFGVRLLRRPQAVA